MEQEKWSILKYRLHHMLIGWGTVIVIYFSVAWRDVQVSILPELWLDEQLAFTPHAIWFYLLFFLFIPFVYLKSPLDKVLYLRYAMQISAVISGFIFFFFPTQLIYPSVAGSNLSEQLLKILMLIDTPKNCFPSLHAALSFIGIFFFWQAKKIVQSILIAFWGVAIMLSIIYLRRHLSLDLISGLCIGLLSCFLAPWLINLLKKKSKKYE